MNEPSLSRIHDSPDHRIHDNAAPVQNVSHNEHSKLLPWLMLCAILGGLAIGFAITAWFMATRSVVQSEATRQQIMEHDALLIREGILKPGELNKGASDYERNRKEK